jgi:hypothetical protein
VSISEVEVDLDEGGVHLEGKGASQYHLLHSTVDAEEKLMRQEELGCHCHLVHPY